MSHLPPSTRAALRTAAAEVRILFDQMHDGYSEVHERALAVASEVGELVSHAAPDIAETIGPEDLRYAGESGEVRLALKWREGLVGLSFDLCRGGRLLLVWSEDGDFITAATLGDGAAVTVADIERVTSEIASKIEKALSGRARANIGRSRSAARTLQGVVDILGASRGASA